MNIRISERIERLAPSETLAVTEKAAALRAQGVDVIAFAAGQPDFDTPQHIKDAAVKALAAGDTKYPSPVSGVTPLRKAICEYFARYGGLDYAPSQICASVGAKDCLYLAFQTLLNPGDEVIFARPYWVSYPDQVRLAGGVPVIVGDATGDLKLKPAELRAAITPRSRVLVVNSPTNPSGVVYSRAEFEALAAVVRDSRLVVVSDEIYHRMSFLDEPCPSFASLPGMHERTVTINGFSKAYAMTGWRLGFAAGPQEIIDGMVRLQGQTTSGPTSFVQTAAIAALTGDQSAVDMMRHAYRERTHRMWEGLNALPGVTCTRPDGAFYCLPDVSGTFDRLGISTPDEFSALAIERAHVALVSGGAFGSSRHVRLSAAVAPDKIDAGLERLARFLGG